MSKLYKELKAILSERGISMSPVDEGYEQFLKTIGSELRGLRMERGLGIETVSADTDMPTNVLEKIEQGEWEWEIWQIAHLRDYYESIPFR